MKFLLVSIFAISIIGFALIPDTFGLTDFVLIPDGSSTTDCNATNACFTPDKIEIEKGDTIRWKNLDTTAHTTTSKNGMFDSGPLLRNIEQNACYPNCSPSFSYTFNEDGKYSYACKIHSWMQGVVIVTSAGTDAEVSACGEGGCAYVDKALHEVTPDKNALVEIYGTLVNPRGGTTVFMSVTLDGKPHVLYPEPLEINKKKSCSAHELCYTTYLNIDYENSGKYSVDVRFEYKNIGTVEFDVVKPIKVEEPIPSEPEHFTLPPPNPNDVFFHVRTDFQSYEKGESIHISGRIPNLDQSDPSKVSQLTLRITDPRNNIVTISQLNPNVDGTYFASINGEGPMWKFGGDYTIMVNYGGQSAYTTFAFTIPENDFPIPSPAGQVPTKASTVLTLNLETGPIGKSALPSSIPSSLEAGTTVRFFGSLMTTDGMPVSDKKISLRNGVDELGYLHTRLDGTFGGTMEMNQVGDDYRVFAFFYGGSSNFETSQSQTEYFAVTQKSITVPPITTPPENDEVIQNWGAVLFWFVVIMAVVIVVVIKKTGKKKIYPFGGKFVPATIPPPSGGGTVGTVTIGKASKPRTTPRAGRAPFIGRFGNVAKRMQKQKSPKTKSKMVTMHYLRCKSCLSEELENYADGQQVCTRCKWRKK